MTNIANVEQYEAWNGADGDDWVQGEEDYNRSMVDFYAALVAAAGVRPGEHVLDIGCGTGESTRDAARAAADGSALGLDLSEQMLARARERAAAEAVTNVSFARGDAQVHPLPAGAFDLFLSRFGVMFFADPVAAFSNIRGALKPDGRACLLVWRSPAENEFFATIRGVCALGRELPAPPPDAPSPFALANPDRVRTIMGSAGFGSIGVVAVDGLMRLGTSIDAALDFLVRGSAGRGMLSGLDEADRARAIAGLRETLEAHAGPEGITFGGAVWIITARAA